MKCKRCGADMYAVKSGVFQYTYSWYCYEEYCKYVSGYHHIPQHIPSKQHIYYVVKLNEIK